MIINPPLDQTAHPLWPRGPRTAAAALPDQRPSFASLLAGGGTGGKAASLAAPANPSVARPFAAVHLFAKAVPWSSDGAAAAGEHRAVPQDDRASLSGQTHPVATAALVQQTGRASLLHRAGPPLRPAAVPVSGSPAGAPAPAWQPAMATFSTHGSVPDSAQTVALMQAARRLAVPAWQGRATLVNVTLSQDLPIPVVAIRVSDLDSGSLDQMTRRIRAELGLRAAAGCTVIVNGRVLRCAKEDI